MKRFALIFALALAAHAQSTVTTTFDGDVGAINAHASYNLSLATTGSYIMELSGANNFCIFNYSGVQQSCTGMSTFLGNVGGISVGTILDPRITYDPFISRPIMGCSCAQDYLIVASGSDPTVATWKGVTLGSNSGDLTMKPAFDANWVYVSENNAGGTSNQFFAIPQADVAWSGAGTISLTHEVSSGFGYTLDAFPATDLNASKPVSGAGSEEYFISRVGSAQNQTNAVFTLSIYKFTPSSATAGSFTASGSATTIATPYLYNTPIAVSQQSTPGLDGTESHRILGAVSVGGTDLWAVWGSGPCTTAVTCTAGIDAQDIVFWFDISIPSLTLKASGKISDPNIGYIFPSVAADSAGNVMITADGGSSSTYMSIYSFVHLATDGVGTMHGPTTVKSGTAVYNCNSTNPAGWGFSSAVQDGGTPANICAVGEYANSASSCVWTSRVMCFSNPSQIVPVGKPTPVFMTDMGRDLGGVQ